MSLFDSFYIHFLQGLGVQMISSVTLGAGSFTPLSFLI